MRTGRPNYSVKASRWWARRRGWKAQDWWPSGGYKMEQSINTSCLRLWGPGCCMQEVLCVAIRQLQCLPSLLWDSDQPWQRQTRLSQFQGVSKYITLCSICTLALVPSQAKIVRCSMLSIPGVFGGFFPRLSSFNFAKDFPIICGNLPYTRNAALI